ncbi:glycosyltransferase [Spirosoma utsteinense]|uniref:Rhamnosyltransferase n=1 Tax=Spirosoma utsteinense TaxID=2585773 RepID=A0ABR6W0G4_9BACT|nr:glycosyltransferase [Spirosoma utsteinense]MBC3783821.1 rhamnosyltransferase [Spirosoma utsteinense]MBC3790035.1 rhamnosyltransferase [Spirosoma utsteinense]
MKEKINKEKVAGAVVLYNSPLETIDNISTYIDQVEKLYVVDNSVKPNAKLVETLKSYSKIHYHSLNGNDGIATALNWAANQAISDNFSVLLTMDDDTQIPVGCIQQMLDFWSQYPANIGILSGIHHIKPDTAPFRKLLYTLTSGNLLSLSAYSATGPFRDDFFIDHVDHEYGIRLNQNGYVVIELPNIRFNHRLGTTDTLKVGGRIISTYGSHSPLRLYYFARNGVYMARQYFSSQPMLSWMVAEELAKRCVKAMFLQSDTKVRMRMLLVGVKDGWVGRLGKYNSSKRN